MLWSPAYSCYRNTGSCYIKALNEIKQAIQDIKILLNTSDVGLVFKYRPRIEEFKKLPPKLKISLPNILPQKINRKELLKQFGSLSPFSVETEGFTLPVDITVTRSGGLVYADYGYSSINLASGTQIQTLITLRE